MKIVRFLAAGAEHLGRLPGDGRGTLLEGDPLGPPRDTGRASAVEKLRAPLEPRAIL